MKSFEARSFEQNEVHNMNQGCYVMVRVKENLESGNITDAKNRLEEVKSLEKFIEQNLPEISKDKVSSKEGFYSPAHMMNNAVKYTEQIISREDEKRKDVIKTAEISADQAIRLMGYGMHAKTMNIPRKDFGFESVSVDLPNLIEIPIDWKLSPEGKDFEKKIKELLVRRKQSERIDQEDFYLLDEMVRLINRSYLDKKFNRDKFEHFPSARELILINLSLLKFEAKKYEGRQMPASKENMCNIQLIRGLFNYNEQNEIEEIKRPGVRQWAESFAPEVIKQPSELRI